MSFEYIQKLPTPDEIREEFPLTKELAKLKK
jgi:3-deoxy-7-phosphoheptulonate synthase